MIDKNDFIKTIKAIFDKEGIVNYDERLLFDYISDDRKNAVAITVTLSDGREVFFKAVKPWGEARGFLDFERGIVLYNLLKKIKIDEGEVFLHDSNFNGIRYHLRKFYSGGTTITDSHLKTLDETDGKKILRRYRHIQSQIKHYLQNHISQGAILLPESSFVEHFSFFGRMTLFERRLVNKGLLNKCAISDYIEKLINSGAFFKNEPHQLLHGDLAPHNIYIGEKIRFIDWERAFIAIDPHIGHDYDLANLYVYSYTNPAFQKSFISDNLSFKIALAYHLLYKANYILLYKGGEKEERLFNWLIEMLKTRLF